MSEEAKDGKDRNLLEEKNTYLSSVMLKNNLLNEDQLHQCIRVQIKPDNRMDLAQIAESLGFINHDVFTKLSQASTRFVTDRAKAGASGFSINASDEENAQVLFKWLDLATKNRASDIHIMAGEPLTIRKNRKLLPHANTVLDREVTIRVLTSILNDEQRETLKRDKCVSICFDLPGGGRVRASIYYHIRGTNGVFRLIPKQIPSIGELNMPTVITNLVTYSHGLVMITGPIGCGKTTTLAALIDIINNQRKNHIITLEDPIEFVHASKSCLVSQRQVGAHTRNFANALRAALREDPDVIVVGEMRDVETARLAITAAETGHLVFTTLHTEDAIRSINRVLDMFPYDEQPQIRTMLSESLRGVISQQLLPRLDTDGLIPIVEIMFNQSGIANLIRERKLYQMKNLLKLTSDVGNISLEDYASKLYWNNIIARPSHLGVAE